VPVPTALDEPLSIQALLDGAMRQARQHFRTVFPAVGVPLALLAATIPLTQGVWFRSLGDMQTGSPNIPLLFAGAGGMMIAAFLFVILNAVGYATLIAAATDAVGGRPVSMSRAWLAMLRPTALLTLFIAGVAVFAGMVCCAIPLCGLPGIYVALLFSMIVPVMVEEETFLFDALGRSASLAQYNPRQDFGTDPRVRSFLVIFVGMLLGYAVSLVIQMPMVVIQQVLLMRDAAAGASADPMALMAKLTWLQVPTTALATLSQVAVQLYVSFGVALLYFDVRRRKEGHDLGAALVSLEKRGPAAGAPA
jgi:hypothetical protein